MNKKIKNRDSKIVTVKHIVSALCLSAAFISGITVQAKGKDSVSLADNLAKVSEVGQYAEVKADCMQKVFENLTKADSDYSKVKKDYTEYVAISERIEGNSIIITAQAKTADYESLNGTWTYALEGDYIVNTYKTSEMFGYTLGLYITQAVSDYLEMDYELVNGYMSAVIKKNLKSDYYSMTIDDAAETISQKIYVAGKYDLSVIDNLYIDKDSLDLLDTLTATITNMATGIGKVSATTFGSKDSFQIIIGEYGDVTELSYKSILEIVKKAQPIGYDEFLKNYTKLEAVSTDYYTVTFPTLAEMKQESETVSEKDKFVKVVFKPELNVKAGTAKKLSLKGETVKKWKTSKKTVATVSKGKITALKKGTATITAVLKDGSELTYTIKVSNSPALTVGGKKYNKKTTYTVKKNKTLKVKITGKASSVKNVYTSADPTVAKVTSKAAASTVKIKGLKTGKTTVTIKVNGVKYKIKVKVK